MILIPVDGKMLGMLLPLLSLQYGAFCSAGGWLPCKVKPTSYLWVLLPFRLSSGIQLTNPLNLLRCFPMCVLKSLHNLSEEQLPVSWHTLYLIKPLRRAWRTAWIASQTHCVSLLETQQSTRVIFFFPHFWFMVWGERNCNVCTGEGRSCPLFPADCKN